MKEQKPVWDRKKAWWTRILFALLLLFLSTAHAEASEIEEEQALKEAKEAVEEALFGEFGFEEVTGALESMFPEGKMDFSKMVKEVEKGDLPMSFEAVGQFVKDQVAYEFGQSKKSLVYIDACSDCGCIC